MGLSDLNIILVRHGESEGNVNLSIYKEKHDCQINLTNLGINQAKESGEFLNKFLIENNLGKTRFFASAYNRATQTMHTIIDQLDDSVKPTEDNIRYDNRLRECEFGDIDGIADEDLKATFPQFYEQMKRDENSEAKYFVRHPRGESPADVGDRCRSFAGAIVRDYEKHGIKTFVIVAHGITIRAFMQELLHAGNFRWYASQKNPANASIYLIQNRKADNRLDIENRQGCIFIPELSK